MLATGSADTTVRVWDVGEEVLPHADEWTRVKRECFLGSSSGSSSNQGMSKQKATEATAIRQKQLFSSVSPDIVALENTLVLGQGDAGDDRNSRSHGSSDDTGLGASSNGVAASSARRRPNQAAPATDASVVAATAAAAAAASKENARGALRSLRPEILRQAGVHPEWRTGRVTAVLDRSVCSLDRPAAAMGPTPGRGKKAKPDPLVEVRYLDGGGIVVWRLVLRLFIS